MSFIRNVKGYVNKVFKEDEEKKVCSVCNKSYPKSWPRCPYCKGEPSSKVKIN
ncbi:MAG TPA: hypothetical protein P5513_05435 [Candidatus Diapherotrites archaeon]|nr:hypothetical protein [Candidatus Diapherotrites archaeon]